MTDAFDLDVPGFEFTQAHRLDTSPGNDMCNFGLTQVAAVGHTGHRFLVRRVLPDRPRGSWPLVSWDEEEQDGVAFALGEGGLLSSYIAAFPDRVREGLADPAVAQVVRARGAERGDGPLDEVVRLVNDGVCSPASLYAAIDPASPLARFHTLAERYPLQGGSRRRRREARPAGRPQGDDLLAWLALIEERPRWNAPLSHLLRLGHATPPLALEALSRSLKHDCGGSVGQRDLVVAAARYLASEAPLPADAPLAPVVEAASEEGDLGGDPFHAAGQAYLRAGEPARAFVCFENAILFERGWSEEYRHDSLAGAREAAATLGNPDLLQYLAS